MSRGVVNQVTPFDTGIQGAIDHAREQNLLLIDKLARGYGNDVREVFRDPAVFGMRVEDVRRLLKKQADITERHAALIARDQTLKLNADITRIRQQNAGIESYRWSTSQDERVRPAHAEQDGRVFSWAEGTPIGYHPGEDYQCRCVAIPVLEETPQEYT